MASVPFVGHKTIGREEVRNLQNINTEEKGVIIQRFIPFSANSLFKSANDALRERFTSHESVELELASLRSLTLTLIVSRSGVSGSGSGSGSGSASAATNSILVSNCHQEQSIRTSCIQTPDLCGEPQWL